MVKTRGLAAPHLRAKKEAILEQAKRLRMAPSNNDGLYDIFANDSTDATWRLDDNEVSSGGRSAVEHIFNGTGTYEKNWIPSGQVARFAGFLRLILGHFGAKPVSQAEAAQLWTVSLTAFRDALTPIHPFRAMLATPGTSYTAQPEWEFDGYQRQALPVIGASEQDHTIFYHWDVKFVHKVRFSNSEIKRVLMLSGVIGRGGLEDGVWQLYPYAAGRPYKDGVKVEVKWPASDPADFSELTSGPHHEVLRDPHTDDVVVAVQDPAVREGQMTFLALGWKAGPDQPKGTAINDWIERQGDGALPTSVADEIARSFLAAQAAGRAELSRCDLWFSENGLRQRPN